MDAALRAGLISSPARDGVCSSRSGLNLLPCPRQLPAGREIALCGLQGVEQRPAWQPSPDVQQASELVQFRALPLKQTREWQSGGGGVCGFLVGWRCSMGRRRPATEKQLG